jgi:uncharacterized protein YdhG (YjbR/CyaY superfamily)
MEMNKKIPKNFDDYADRFPKEARQLLKKMRLTIRKAAPKAKEKISYGMPAYFQEGILVWFAAHKNHIGLYPRASGVTAFKKELSGYKWAKGSVQFPFDKPLPLKLVSRIVKFRVKRNLSKEKK